MKQTLQIAVRTLVEHVLRSGDLEQTFLGISRAVEGVRAHQAIQKSRPKSYAAEITVSHSIETDRFILIVGGRIDGVFRGSDPVVVEEIKTTLHDPDPLVNREDSVHWGQAKCYAYLYALTHGLSEIAVQLTYCRLDTGETREIRKVISTADLEVFFQDLVSKYLFWARTVTDWCETRDASIRILPFPYPAYRPGQREMAVDVYRTIRNEGQILIQAATGIGKTMAVLFPSLKALGEGRLPKIFYLTARTTGKAAAEKAFDAIRAQGGRIKSLTLTAKERICFNPDSACSAEECEYAKGHFDRINEALREIFGQEALNRDTITETALRHRVCPFEFSLELSLWSDCIICDYNYAFDPRVFLRRFFMEENTGYVFLIDEAHNLVDRAREMFSAEIRKQPLLGLRRSIKNELPSIYRSMGKINARFAKYRRACEEAQGALAQKEAPHSLVPLLRQFLRGTESWLVQNIKAPFREKLLELYFSVSTFLKIWELYDDNYATCTEKIGDDLRLKLFCINPAVSLKSALTRCGAAIFFSATLTPADYFKKNFGCEPDARVRVLPSSFPPENLCVLLSARISTRYRHRTASTPAVAAELIRLVSQKPGNYLLFFPSYEYLQHVLALFSRAEPEMEILIQTPEMSETERDRFLEHFASENRKTRVGFVVMGGVFGEGIDLAGDRLSGAAIVGVGLPAICLERELIRGYFADHLGAGFEYAYLYPGMIRVLQAAGRVIRSENDRGVIVLIGQRFAAYPYRNLLPAHWQPQTIADDTHFKQVLDAFWKK